MFSSMFPLINRKSISLKQIIALFPIFSLGNILSSIPQEGSLDHQHPLLNKCAQSPSFCQGSRAHNINVMLIAKYGVKNLMGGSGRWVPVCPLMHLLSQPAGTTPDSDSLNPVESAGHLNSLFSAFNLWKVPTLTYPIIKRRVQLTHVYKWLTQLGK